VWGEQIEDRGSQITFSALGQQAPLEEKEKWDPDISQAEEDQSDPRHVIPKFSVRIGARHPLISPNLASIKPMASENFATCWAFH
jgi:hypothetical protein